MKLTHQFDELYAISDLHLGGAPSFQMFNAGTELARLIDHLRGQPAERQLALVINGDFVDFLAEAPAKHFDPDGAVCKLDRIVADPAFAPAWEALRRFVRTRHRRLVINLGNHDLELALPWVREHLLDILANGNDAARGRITLILDGSGFLCAVSGAKVLCVHGNEVDTWNVADYERLRRIGRDLTQGIAVDPWIPNAGSQLVIEVMNRIKRFYPFVDLLKPEIAAVVPTLLALDPGQLDRVNAIGRTVRRLFWDRLRTATGFLEGEPTGSIDRPVGTAAGPIPDHDLESVPYTLSTNETNPAGYAEAMLELTEQRLSDNREPLSLIPPEVQSEQLGKLGALWNIIRREKPSEVLREALRDLRKDKSFDLSSADDTFEQLDALISAEVDFLLAGHTHLERALRRKRGRGYYFNSGTWTRLIRLEERVLSSPEKFAQVFERFRAGAIQALDQPDDLVLRRLTVVCIWAEGGQVHGALRHVSLDPAAEVFEPVPGSQFIST